jgi:hypothetical protein
MSSATVIDRMTFDFDKWIFKDATGAQITRAGFDRIAATDDARRANAGGGTIARTIFTHALLRAQVGGNGERISQIMGQWSSLPSGATDSTDAEGGGNCAGLDNIAYSRDIGAALTSGLNNVRGVKLATGYRGLVSRECSTIS